MKVSELAKECWIEGPFEKVYSLVTRNDEVVCIYEYGANWMNNLSMVLANQEVLCINLEKKELITIERQEDSDVKTTELLSKYGLIDLGDDAKPVEVPRVVEVKE